MGFRALFATKSTLKWFVIIGLVIVVIGVLLSFVTFAGIILIWLGFFLITISIIILLYLWLTDQYLPQPRTDPVPRRR